VFAKRITGVVLLLATWSAFGLWQYQRFRYERTLIEESTRQSADSVMTALLGGIRSHRRLGRFFEQQLEGMLEELTLSQNVRVVAVFSDDGKRFLQAGEIELLESGMSGFASEQWDETGFRVMASFEIESTAEGPGMGPGAGSGAGPGAGTGMGAGSGTGMGMGMGDGAGAGRGMGYGTGRGLGWRQDAPPEEVRTFATGGRFHAALVLDRARHDQLVRRAAWTSFSVVLAGGLVLISITAAWRASVRLVTARGRARVLEVETQHWRDLSQAAAGLAHETRNPLGLIRGWTQRLACRQTETAEQERYVQAVIEECDRVTARINQFLAFARPCDPHCTDVDLAELVGELQAILQPDLEAKRLQCQFEQQVPPGKRLRADRELLRQVLFNLVQNAIEFAPEGDAVTIRLAQGCGNRLRIEVMDRGPGVEPSAQASLFVPYFTTRSEGTGLGLAIVRRIASAHGWTTGYAPRTSGGAVFWLDEIHGS